MSELVMRTIHVLFYICNLKNATCRWWCISWFWFEWMNFILVAMI